MHMYMHMHMHDEQMRGLMCGCPHTLQAPHTRELTKCGWAADVDQGDAEAVATPERVAALLARAREAQVCVCVCVNIAPVHCCG